MSIVKKMKIINITIEFFIAGMGVGGAGLPITRIPFVNLPNSRLPSQ